MEREEGGEEEEAAVDGLRRHHQTGQQEAEGGVRRCDAIPICMSCCFCLCFLAGAWHLGGLFQY